MDVVTLEDLSAGYSKTSTVLHDVSCGFTTGVTCLVGPNGSGKSTMLRTIGTLLRPARGRVLISGSPLVGRKRVAAARRELGYMPQESCYPPNISVAEALIYSAWLSRLPTRQAHTAIDSALDRWDLGSFRKTPLRALSTGTRRRVDIAGCMLHDPAVVLLDEPTAGVDLEHRAALRTTLKSLGDDRAVIVSSHIAEDVEVLAEHVAALKGGHLVFMGTAAELLEMAAALDRQPNESLTERAVRWALTYA